MEFELKDLIYIIGIVTSVLVSFYGTRHRMKEYIRDRNDALKDEVNDLKIKLEALKSKDALQQQVIDQIGNQMDELIPNLVEALKYKKARK